MVRLCVWRGFVCRCLFFDAGEILLWFEWGMIAFVAFAEWLGYGGFGADFQSVRRIFTLPILSL